MDKIKLAVMVEVYLRFEDMLTDDYKKAYRQAISKALKDINA